MRTRQRLLRALITDIIADVDDATREVVLTIRWRGGQHSQLRIRKPKSGEHGCRTPDEALAVMRNMATRWSDADIAATLNRMGIPAGQRKTWTAHRVSSVRRVNGIHAYRSPRRTASGSPCPRPLRRSASRITAFAGWSRMASCPPSRSYRARRTKSEPTICRTNG